MKALEVRIKEIADVCQAKRRVEPKNKIDELEYTIFLNKIFHRITRWNRHAELRGDFWEATKQSMKSGQQWMIFARKTSARSLILADAEPTTRAEAEEACCARR